MGPGWVRLSVALAFVLAWAAPFYIDAASVDDASGNDEIDVGTQALLLIFYGGLTLLTGFVVRWPALLLPFVIYVVLTPLGVHPEDSDGWTYAGLYAIPAGFFSFFVLLFGWLVRVGLDRMQRRHGPEPAAPPPSDGSRGTRRNVLIPLGIALVAGLSVAGLIVSSNSTDVKVPRVTVDGARNPLKPEDTELQLRAGGVDGCADTERKVVDLSVDETPKEVVIDASLEVHEEFSCDSGTPWTLFIAPLKAPLGDRTVIDNSRGERTVIWSAEIGERFRGLSVESAKRFLLSKRSGTDARCIRHNAHFFGCDYRRADTGRRSSVTLTVLPTGELALGVK